MGQYPKAQKAKEYRTQIGEWVKKYINENTQNNAGQLKFFKGLLTGNLSVTNTDIGRVIRRDARFQKYLNEEILRNNDEVISFFDKEKNLAELINASCWNFEAAPEEIYRGFVPKCELPPYLLMRKAKDLMEKEFMHYIGYCMADEKTKAWREKNDAYLNLLYSIAFYEICLTEYKFDISKIPRPEGDAADSALKDDRALRERFPGAFSKNMDEERRKADRRALLTAVCEEYYEILEMDIVTKAGYYWVLHVFNLCAMLRIVFLIEYVKVSLSKNPEDNGKDDGDWSAVNEAAFWLGRADEWGDCNLFSTTSINHSLMVYGNRLSRVFRANDISPRMEPDRTFSCFCSNINQIRLMISRHAWNQTGASRSVPKNFLTVKQR